MTLNVIVGPNNSGKSLMLRELNAACVSQDLLLGHSVLNTTEFNSLASDQVSQILKEKRPPRDGNAGAYQLDLDGEVVSFDNIDQSTILEQLGSPNADQRWFRAHYASRAVEVLDATRRMRMLSNKELSKLEPRLGISRETLQNGDARKRIQRTLHEATGLQIVFDVATHPGQLTFKFSSSPPDETLPELCMDDSTRRRHEGLRGIDSLSDGSKVFAGLIQLIEMSSRKKLVLLDEPEAYLHPSWCFKLAQHIGREARKNEQQYFIATHSESFLSGAVQSGVPLNVIRLTFEHGTPTRKAGATARMLDAASIAKTFRSPWHRSMGTVSALFRNSTVFTEGETDRMFYHEINQRLLEEGKGRGLEHSLFISSGGKDAVGKSVRFLRDMGIPAAVIVDFDALKPDSGTIGHLIKELGLPAHDEKTLKTLRGDLGQAWKGYGYAKTNGGIDALSNPQKACAERILSLLAEYGCFIVPNGGMESWLTELSISGQKVGWLENAFDRLGENPNGASYVRAGDGDVWGFLQEIANWTQNVERKGM